MGETKITAEVPLTEATSDLISRIEKANSKSRVVGLITLALITVLVGLGVLGIYKQNTIAKTTQEHTDCIIKDLSTPLPAGSTHKYIDIQSRLTADCHIKFAP